MSLFQQVNQQQSQNASLIQQAQQIKQVFQKIQNCSNPTGMLQEMIASNPKSQEILRYLKEAGGNPQQAFMNMAKDKGENPNEILNILQ